MNIELKPGRYVVAVSGGVDSVVLLDLLCAQTLNPHKNLSVAHFDHGIRKNSARDRKFVEKLAKGSGLEFFYEEGRLGPDASEALAREKRYEFLESVKERANADAIITAHHQDDVVETIIINLLRGTGRKGLSSLSARPGIERPLLDYPKKELLDYARSKDLQWREDETNLDDKYLRNYIRNNLVEKLSDTDRKTLIGFYHEAKIRNRQIDNLLDDLFFKNDGIPRQLFAGLSHAVSAEIIAVWLRKENIRLDKKTVERLVVKLKTAGEGKLIQAGDSRFFLVRDGIIRMNTS